MKNFKIFFIATVAVIAGVFSSCTDDENYKAGPGTDGAEVYFPENAATNYSISDDVTSIAVPLNRIAKDEALNVAILASDESGLFTVPSSVAFAAGSATTELQITFDRTKLEDGKEYPLSLLINDEVNTTPYGNSTLDIVVMPWPWELVGTGLYREDYLGPLFGAVSPEIEVQIHKHKTNEGVYMIEDMFGWNYLTEVFEATQDELSEQWSYTPTNIVIDCSNPQAVTIAQQWTGITETVHGYGNFLFFSDKPGTLINGVITFPASGLICGMAGTGKAYYANTEGNFRLVLPGVEVADYSLTAAYGGMKVAPDNQTASAVVDFAYGADVTGISYVFAEGDVTAEAAKIAAAVADGTAENIYKVEDFVAGGKTVSVETVLDAAGIYTVVALPADKAGKPVEAEAAAVSFFFPGLGGSDIPECDLDAMLGLVSEYWPEQSADCPDISSLYFEITGSELKSLSTLLGPTAQFEAEIAAGATYEQLIDADGADRTGTYMTYVNEKGFYGSAWINLRSNTSYTMIVKATNTYGKTKVVTATCSTAAVPYSGELVIGDYLMHFDAPLQDGSTIPLENIFSVSPQKAGNETDFFVTDFGLEIGVDWYSKYDSAASALTLDGVWRGNEASGSFLGRWVGIDATTAVLFFSYDPADEEPKGDAPIVIEVDPSTKRPVGLKTNVEILVGTISGGKVTNEQLEAMFYADGTTIVPYGAAPASKALALGLDRSVKVPFSGARVPAGIQSPCFGRTAMHNAQTGMRNFAAAGVKTLRVKTAKCDPLPKQTGARSVKKGANSLPLM